MKLFEEIELDQKAVDEFSITGGLPVRRRIWMGLTVLALAALVFFFLVPAAVGMLQDFTASNRPFQKVCIGDEFVSEPWWRQPHCNYWFSSREEADRYMKNVKGR